MPELSSLIQKIDFLKSELDKLLPMKAEDQQRLDKKFRLEWNYNSNHIEGNTLTYGQTELLIMFGKTTGDHDIREYQEMKAHDAALKLVKEYANDKTRHLSEADIRELNRMILVEPYYGVAWTEDGQQTRKLIQPGVYKKEPNSVRLQNGEMFHYASPDETPIKMAELMDWFRKVESDKKLHPVQITAQLHYDFVRIHPFDDSNGRTSRLLMNYVLIRYGFPPVVIKSSDKKNYLTALNKADVGDLDSFVEYVAMELVWSLGVYLKAAKGESIEEGDDVYKEIDLLKRKAKNELLAVVPKSINGMQQLLDSSVGLLIELFIEKQSLFNEFFLVNEIWVGFDGNQQQINDSHSAKSFFKTVLKSYSTIHDFANKESSWSISFIRRNLKIPTTVELFFNESISIVFRPLKYDLFLNNIVMASRKYSDNLSNLEVEELVRSTAKSVKAKLPA
jgi:Fic family protein